MSEAIPTLNPGENYWAAIGLDHPHVHANHTDDFGSLMHPLAAIQDGSPRVIPLTGPGSVTDPAALPPGLLPGINDKDKDVMTEREFLHGDTKHVDSGQHKPSSQAGLATFAPLLNRIGPGASSMIERELDRARAFEVIARAAVAFMGSEGDGVVNAYKDLAEAVAENRGAL